MVEVEAVLSPRPPALGQAYFEATDLQAMDVGDEAGREQRTVFGEAAELYDRARAGCPEELVDDVVTHCAAATPRALEVGPGTGKATVALAARGVEIVALEPSAAMANVAARRCASFPR